MIKLWHKKRTTIIPNGLRKKDKERGCNWREAVHLQASTKAGFPTRGDPRVTQRTSASGYSYDAHADASVASAPPSECPQHSTRVGVAPPEISSNTIPMWRSGVSGSVTLRNWFMNPVFTESACR